MTYCLVQIVNYRNDRAFDFNVDSDFDLSAEILTNPSYCGPKEFDNFKFSVY